MTHSSSEQHKKKIILILLILSCFITLMLLVFLSPPPENQLKTPAQVDSVIVDLFNQFNIFESQIERKTVKVDTVFSRTTYTVKVPYNFSESHWHYRLNKKLNIYDVKTPATVSLPLKKTRIHMVANNTVFRTIEFQEDTTTMLQRLPVYLFIRFNDVPAESILAEILRLGEPIPVAIPIQPMLNFNNEYDYLYKTYSRLIYHWSEADNSRLNPWNDTAIMLQKFKQLYNVDRNPQILAYKEVVQSLSPGVQQKLAELNIHFYDRSEAMVITEDQGLYQFEQQLKQALKQARNGRTPTLLLEGSPKTVEWLHHLLPEYRQSGLFVKAPRTISL